MATSTAFWQNRRQNHCYSNRISLPANYHVIAWMCVDSARAVRLVNAHMHKSQRRAPAERGIRKGVSAIDPTR